MMKLNEKSRNLGKDYGSNTDLKSELTMNKYTLTQNKFQFNPGDLPEQTKLSRLPKLADRPKFELPPKGAACAGCGGRLDGDDNFQQSVKVCRKCLAHYALIDQAIDAASKRKRQTMLEKFAAEVK
jgi:hypothetical protein